MPNLKNAKKRVLVNVKKEKAIKNVERAITSKDKDKANDKLKTAIKAIDKATGKGVTSKNTAARNKSRLSKKVNSME